MIASRSASGPIAQNTVSRMIIGGSTGFRMMIALPRWAPPTASMACAVVSVNSSMLARVPGPAERDAMDATISAYGTGVTRETACTIGIVACPPQVIMLMFGASGCTSALTGGQTNGPMAAGVRSMARDAGLGIPRGVGQVRLGARWPRRPGRAVVLAQQPVHAAGASRRRRAAGSRQPVGRRVDADHVRTSMALAALQLDEQVGADVAGPDDGGDAHAVESDGRRTTCGSKPFRSPKRSRLDRFRPPDEWPVPRRPSEESRRSR